MAFWIALLAAMVLSVFGQALLKAGAGAPSFATQLLDWRTGAGLSIYASSALLYIIALRRLPLSTALPCTAASYLIVALIGRYGFGEPLGAQQLAALALIGMGVLLLAAA